MINVRKETGHHQEYEKDKLINSLRYTGATPEQIDDICRCVEKSLHEGITTRKIYNIAFKRLRKISRPLSAYYGTKRALLDLGPDGFIFEKFVAKILENIGFEAITNVIIPGACVDHEVDVVAQNPQEHILVECKFHSTKERRNDLKTALYIKARSLDIFDGPQGGKYDEFWLISNTSFSEDAIRYSTCAGLRLWGANFPPQNTLQDVIRDNGLDPITCLASLKKGEKKMLLDSEVLMAKDIRSNPKTLKDIGLESTRIRRVLHEIDKILPKE
jgi:hypothetical protein